MAEKIFADDCECGPVQRYQARWSPGQPWQREVVPVGAPRSGSNAPNGVRWEYRGFPPRLTQILPDTPEMMAAKEAQIQKQRAAAAEHQRRVNAEYVKKAQEQVEEARRNGTLVLAPHGRLRTGVLVTDGGPPPSVGTEPPRPAPQATRSEAEMRVLMRRMKVKID